MHQGVIDASFQPWGGSWPYSAAGKLGLCWCSPILSSPSPGPAAPAQPQLCASSFREPLPTHPGVAPKPGGPGWHCPAQSPAPAVWHCREPVAPCQDGLCLLYTSPSAFKHGLDLPKALGEVQQNLQMFSAREVSQGV